MSDNDKLPNLKEKFKQALNSTFKVISDEIEIKKEISDKKLDEIEEFLISSDVGIEASSKIKSIISEKKINPNLDQVSEINNLLKEFIISSSKFSSLVELKNLSSSICFFEILFRISLHLLD